MSLTMLSSLDLVEAHLVRHLSVKSFNLLNRTCKSLNGIFQQVPFTSIEHGRLEYLDLVRLFKKTGDAKYERSLPKHGENDWDEHWEITLNVPSSLKHETVMEGYRKVRLVWDNYDHIIRIEFIDEQLRNEVEKSMAHDNDEASPWNIITNYVFWDFRVHADGISLKRRGGWGNWVSNTRLDNFNNVWVLVLGEELETIPLINSLEDEDGDESNDLNPPGPYDWPVGHPYSLFPSPDYESPDHDSLDHDSDQEDRFDWDLYDGLE